MTPHSPSRTPHKHAALIKAWADGTAIQYLERSTCDWKDDPSPVWNVNIHYRIKQTTIKYRCYLNKYGAIIVIRHGEDPLVWFHQWLGDWQEVEV